MRGRIGERADEAETQFDPFIGGENAIFPAGHWLDLGEVVADSDAAGAIWINGLGLQEAWVARVGMSPAWMRSELLAI